MKNLLVLLMMLGAIQSWAADGGSMPVPSQAKLRPKLVKSGDDYYLDMQDGRVAGFFQTIGKVARGNIGMRQIENTCDFAQELTDCSLELDLAIRGFSVRWVKHPDATKLQTVVTAIKTDSNGKPAKEALADDNNNFFWYGSLKDKTYASLVKPDRLICNSFAWAKNIPVINARLKIDSWATEVMFPSTETQINENQSASVVFDVVLKSIDAKTLEFESFGTSKEFINSLPPYLATQVANLTFIDKNKHQCQVSFESSLDSLNKVARDPDFRKLDPATTRPLRNAAVISNTNFGSTIQTLLRTDTTWEVE